MKRALSFLLLFLPLSAAAHDFWIEPSTFRPRPGAFVQLRLRVGEHYLGDPVPRKPDGQLVRFDALTAEGILAVVGREGRDPAGVLRVEKEGMLVVAYHNQPSFVELTPDRVDVYLGAEGLEAIGAEWKRSTKGSKPWREIYSRCAKALLWTGSGPAALYNKPLGLPLEIIPEKNPYTLKAGATLPVQLLYRGKPLKGAMVMAVSRAQPLQKIRVRSDRHGRARFRLPVSGDWLIKAVHLVPAPSHARGEWESFWASLTFDLTTAAQAK